MEGNTLLHKRQYQYEGLDIAQHIIKNKICNQRKVLGRIRRKASEIKEGIALLDSYLQKLNSRNYDELQSLLGVEGAASRVYFSRLFSEFQWKGRKPRVKNDYINTVLDIGYTMLFNFIDAILQIYGFDVYYGVLHTCFYMRKSLVCDIMEPFRPIVDWKIRIAINHGQCKIDDFEYINHQYCLKYKKNAEYASFIMKGILEYKMDIFYYVQSYYRCFMKGRKIEQYPIFNMEKTV